MAGEEVVLRGAVLPDGTLQVAGRVALPAGPVEVVVRPVAAVQKGEGFLEVLARIDAARQARTDYVPRTAEEIDAALREMRDEWEEHQLAIEQLQEECWRARQSESSPETPS